MSRHFEFNEEDFNDAKKFMKKLRAMLKEMKDKLGDEGKIEYNDFMREKRDFKSGGSKRFSLFEGAVKVTDFMITNGIENFFSITRKGGDGYEKNIDEVYEHYVNANLDFSETFINNVNYLLEYYVEDEQYEKCVYLQWLQEQYSEHMSK